MAANITTYLSNKFLDLGFGQVPYSTPTVYLGAFLATPAMPAGTGGTEPTGGAYARPVTTGLWTLASAESKTTSGNIVYTTATADWGIINGIGAFDAATGGNLLWAGALATPKSILNGDTFQINAGNLTATLF